MNDTNPNRAPAASPIAAPDLPPYPAYRPAGVAWLDAVPAHWEVRRLKNICRLSYGDSLRAERRMPGDIPVYGSNGLVGYHTAPNTDGQCIIVGRKGSFGKVHYSDQSAFAIDTAFYIDRRHTDANMRWLYYLLGWLKLDAFSKDSAIPGLNREDAYQQICLVPPPAEQAAIVRYLDAALGRMARARAAQARRAELLREYRQAAIQEAVTRGLDAAVPLRASSVEWLGEVPAHWEVRRLKYWVGINEQTLSESTDPSFEFRYLEIGGVGTGRLVAEPTRIRFANAPSRARRVVRTGDTIISTVRTYLKAVWFADDVTDATICSTGFAVLTPRAGTAPKFVNYLAQSNFLTDRIVAESEGVAYPAIADSKFKAIHIPVPPRDEQAAIVAHLDGVTAVVDAGIARSQRAVALLDEYGAGLIAAVVTGQVDVRDAVGSLTAGV